MSNVRHRENRTAEVTLGLGLLLPLEKIPIFIWSLTLIGIGGYLAVQEPLFSWPQAKAIGIFLVGFAGFAYDVVKRVQAKSATANSNDGDV